MDVFYKYIIICLYKYIKMPIPKLLRTGTRNRVGES